jgi:hypothetical protein
MSLTLFDGQLQLKDRTPPGPNDQLYCFVDGRSRSYHDYEEFKQDPLRVPVQAAIQATWGGFDRLAIRKTWEWLVNEEKVERQKAAHLPLPELARRLGIQTAGDREGRPANGERQALILLSEDAGRTNQQIADLLGLKIGTVKNYPKLRAARKLLREQRRSLPRGHLTSNDDGSKTLEAEW